MLIHMIIKKTYYGTSSSGKLVHCYTLKNHSGIEVKIITFGGIITSIKTPDKYGHKKNIVLSYDTLNQYEKDTHFLGGIIGRYANRISNGVFTIDGTKYKLHVNDNPNHLHGGEKGFHKVIWEAKTETTKDTASLMLTYVSKHMEEGFPGTLLVTVTYTLRANNILDISYQATTDKKTIVNLTNHSYFNLSGNPTKQIIDHDLYINADELLPLNRFFIPNGNRKLVKNTPFDFTITKRIGQDIDSQDNQMQLCHGYDHCWILKNKNKNLLHGATLTHTLSGRALEIFSNEPGLQLYTGNYLQGVFEKRTGLCLETQHYPNSPNQSKFPSVLLEPNGRYSSKTSLLFSNSSLQ